MEYPRPAQLTPRGVSRGWQLHDHRPRAALEDISPEVLIRIHYHPAHMSERFASLPSTALGFTIVTIANPTRALPATPAVLLTAGIALYLALFGYTRWHTFRTLATPRLITAAAILTLTWPAQHQPAAATTAQILALLLALNATEQLLIRRHNGDITAWLTQRGNPSTPTG